MFSSLLMLVGKANFEPSKASLGLQKMRRPEFKASFEVMILNSTLVIGKGEPQLSWVVTK